MGTEELLDQFVELGYVAITLDDSDVTFVGVDCYTCRVIATVFKTLQSGDEGAKDLGTSLCAVYVEISENTAHQ